MMNIVYNSSVSLIIHSLTATANRIDQPFALLALGLVGDIGVHLYVAQGGLDWHKHIDEDELFLVHEGGLRIESELGKNTLYQAEALLVPKGVGHRSQSALRSIVLLFRQQVMPERKNGRRTYIVTEGREPLVKARLGSLIGESSAPYTPAAVAVLEGFQLAVFAAKGAGPASAGQSSGTLLYITEGTLDIEFDAGSERLEQGQLTILPPHIPYKLQAAQPAIVVKFERL